MPTTGEVVAMRVQELYDKLFAFIPNLALALVALILGWLIGSVLGGLAEKILDTLKIDSLANSVGLDRLSARTGKKLSISAFAKWLVKWFFIVASFLIAADLLNMPQVGSFLLEKVIPYFGHVIVAMAILLIGTVAANFLQGVVRHALQAGDLRTSDALSLVTRWSIMIFAILAAIAELQVASAFVQDLFRAIIAMLAIAGGIAFGLGGQGHAKKVLDAVEDDVTGK